MLSPFDYKDKEKYPTHVSEKCFKEKHIDLLLIEEKGRKLYVLVKDFNRFLYDDTLHHRRNHICCVCLQAFCAEEILKSHVNECSKIIGKQMIKTPRR